MVFKGRTSETTKAYCFYLLKSKERSLRSIAKECGTSPASVLRIKKTFHSGKQEAKPTKRTSKTGRKERLTCRQKRKLIRHLNSLRREGGNFTASRLMQEAGISIQEASLRTITRFLNKEGYFSLQTRKKGLLSQRDMRKRLIFAKRVKEKFPESLWEKQIAFYLDGTSFTYKRNPMDQARAPRGRVWRKRSGGLAYGCTTKGRKEGTGGKLVKLVVAISHDRGVVACEPYERMCGKYFASFIDNNFDQMFERAGKGESRMWLQDGDPSQKSALARTAMLRTNAKLLKIPPRSPDINPIENVFHTVGRKLRADAIRLQISRESHAEFQQRVINTIYNIPVEIINNTIASMPRRIRNIIRNKGNRTKY